MEEELTKAQLERDDMGSNPWFRPLQKWVMYKHRYFVFYALLVGLSIVLLTINTTLVPPGLSDAESKSIVQSSALNFDTPLANVIDMPYHLLQKISVEFFGVTPIGVKLASTVLGLASIMFTLLIARRWFQTNVALVVGVILVSSAWLISLARIGTPDIAVVFWTSLAVLIATYISQQTSKQKWWRLALMLVTALSLYSPLMIYLPLAALLAVILQPHLRFILKEEGKLMLLFGILGAMIILLPLGWAIFKDVSVLGAIFGIPQNMPGFMDFFKNIWSAVTSFASPLKVGTGLTVTPLISITLVVLLLLGLRRLLAHFHSVRTHVLVLWLAVLMPIVGLNPDNLAILFVPSMLIIAIGMQVVIEYWYKFFPLNPYARGFGILPIAILLIVIAQGSLQQYFLSLAYHPNVNSVYKTDVFLAEKAISSQDSNKKIALVINQNDREIYEVVAKKHSNVQISTDGNIGIFNAEQMLVAENKVPETQGFVSNKTPEMIVNDRLDDALRFRFYK